MIDSIESSTPSFFADGSEAIFLNDAARVWEVVPSTQNIFQNL
jgi:hypothetical protein